MALTDKQISQVRAGVFPDALDPSRDFGRNHLNDVFMLFVGTQAAPHGTGLVSRFIRFQPSQELLFWSKRQCPEPCTFGRANLIDCSGGPKSCALTQTLGALAAPHTDVCCRERGAAIALGMSHPAVSGIEIIYFGIVRPLVETVQQDRLLSSQFDHIRIGTVTVQWRGIARYERGHIPVGPRGLETDAWPLPHFDGVTCASEIKSSPCGRICLAWGRVGVVESGPFVLFPSPLPA